MKSTVIRVQFFEPINGKTVYYFGSVKAIFDLFTREQVGCSMASIYSSGLKSGHSRGTDKCTIEKAEVYRSSQRARV